MPWQTPTLREVRSLVRDSIRGSLPGADALVPNSVLRVLSDNQGAVSHLTLQYLDWLALQLMPDTAETEWLDRHADIWLINADGSTGRKMATLATGTVNFTGTGGTVVPLATRLTGVGVEYETTDEITILRDAATPAPVRALDPGSVGNADAESSVSLTNELVGVTGVTMVELTGGVDEEDDDDLRVRVLKRIRQPPQGGAKHDFERWALAVPGVTRAWCSLEMGIGTATVRFMMDDLRAGNNGFPTGADVQAVIAYIDTVRPVAVKDFFVVAPIPQRVDVYIQNLIPDTTATRAAIEVSLQEMLFRDAAPGGTIFAAWKAYAIMNAANVKSFELRIWDDDVMTSPGHMAVLGDIVYGVTETGA